MPPDSAPKVPPQVLHLPAPVGAPASEFEPASEYKKNSGGKDEWQQIVKADRLNVLDTPTQPLNVSLIARREELLEALELEIGERRFADPFHMHQTANRLFTSDSVINYAPGVCLGSVWTIKMWGFAAVVGWVDPLAQYEKAVAILVETLRSELTALQESGKPLPAMVLHFDGDAAYEKKPRMFSHAMFAPYVALLLEEALGTEIHLVITKVDKMQTDDLTELFAKFADQKSDGEWKLRTKPSGPEEDPMHWYPCFHSVFASCAVVAERTYSFAESELKNAKLLDSVLGNRVQKKFCICVGGNTEDGVGALSAWMQRGSLPTVAKFDSAVRVGAWVLKP